MTFAIGIPTLNRADLLLPSIKEYIKDFEDINIYIIDNGNQDITQKIISDKELYEKRRNLFVFENSKNIGVGASWNMLCYFIFPKNENALILNDDIYLGKNRKEIEELIRKRGDSFLTATPDWCSFILSKNNNCRYRIFIFMRKICFEVASVAFLSSNEAHHSSET